MLFWRKPVRLVTCCVWSGEPEAVSGDSKEDIKFFDANEVGFVTQTVAKSQGKLKRGSKLTKILQPASLVSRALQRSQASTRPTVATVDRVLTLPKEKIKFFDTNELEFVALTDGESQGKLKAVDDAPARDSAQVIAPQPVDSFSLPATATADVTVAHPLVKAESVQATAPACATSVTSFEDSAWSWWWWLVASFEAVVYVTIMAVAALMSAHVVDISMLLEPISLHWPSPTWLTASVALLSRAKAALHSIASRAKAATVKQLGTRRRSGRSKTHCSIKSGRKWCSWEQDCAIKLLAAWLSAIKLYWKALSGGSGIECWIRSSGRLLEQKGSSCWCTFMLYANALGRALASIAAGGSELPSQAGQWSKASAKALASGAAAVSWRSTPTQWKYALLALIHHERSSASSTCAGSSASSPCMTSAYSSYQALLAMQAHGERLCPGLTGMCPIMSILVIVVRMHEAQALQAVLAMCAIVGALEVLGTVTATWTPVAPILHAVKASAIEVASLLDATKATTLPQTGAHTAHGRKPFFWLTGAGQGTGGRGSGGLGSRGGQGSIRGRGRARCPGRGRTLPPTGFDPFPSLPGKQMPTCQQQYADCAFEPTPFSSNWRWLIDPSARKLSSGGTAEVYWAEERLAPGAAGPVKRVAVKQVMGVQRASVAQLVQQEDAMLRKMAGRPYTVDYYGKFEGRTSSHETSVYLVMGLVLGKDLFGVCQKLHASTICLSAEQADALKGWTCHLALHVLHALALALEEVHLVTAHRDLKPANVMLTGLDTGRVGVKIIDWASSCSVDEEQCWPCYTVQFAPPELLRVFGQKECQVPAGAPYDMWALGAIFQQLLAATSQLGPLFLPDPTLAAGVQDLKERELVLHKLVAAEHGAWAEMHADLSKGNLAPQSAGKQLHNLPKAVSCSAACGSFAQQIAAEDVARLLASLCHPDPSFRAVAADVCSLAWLKKAVARPLPPCPVTKLSM